MTGDLFAFADDRTAGAPAPAPASKPRLERPTQSRLESRAFTIAVSDMVTKARGKDDPGAALRTVRGWLADREGLDVTEREIAAVTHRHWEKVGRRAVPTFAEAMLHVVRFDWVPK